MHEQLRIKRAKKYWENSEYRNEIKQKATDFFHWYLDEQPTIVKDYGLRNIDTAAKHVAKIVLGDEMGYGTTPHLEELDGINEDVRKHAADLMENDPVIKKKIQELYKIGVDHWAHRLEKWADIPQDLSKLKEHLDEKGISLDEIALVGIDRGGRIPGLSYHHALNKPINFIKIDQEEHRLSIKPEALEKLRDKVAGKYVIFIDSYSRYGRQKQIIKKQFGPQGKQENSNILGWSIMMDSDFADIKTKWETLMRHSIEDNSEIIGIDYTDELELVPTHTTNSQALRDAIKRVCKDVQLTNEIQPSTKRQKVAG